MKTREELFDYFYGIATTTPKPNKRASIAKHICEMLKGPESLHHTIGLISTLQTSAHYQAQNDREEESIRREAEQEEIIYREFFLAWGGLVYSEVPFIIVHVNAISAGSTVYYRRDEEEIKRIADQLQRESDLRGGEYSYSIFDQGGRHVYRTIPKYPPRLTVGASLNLSNSIVRTQGTKQSYAVYFDQEYHLWYLTFCGIVVELCFEQTAITALYSRWKESDDTSLYVVNTEEPSMFLHLDLLMKRRECVLIDTRSKSNTPDPFGDWNLTAVFGEDLYVAELAFRRIAKHTLYSLEQAAVRIQTILSSGYGIIFLSDDEEQGEEVLALARQVRQLIPPHQASLF